MNSVSKKQYLFTLVLMILCGLLGAVLSSAIVTAQSNRAQQTNSSAPASVQKWDYRVISGNPGSVEGSLNWLGDQGYEVAGFAATGGDLGYQSLSVLLRRPKP